MNSRRPRRSQRPTAAKRRRVLWLCGGLLAVVAVVAALAFTGWAPRWGRKVAQAGIESVRVPGRITFTKDIAPIIFTRCSGCHRPGETAPFNLLTFDDVRRRAQQVAEVTENRSMPPWLPEPGDEPFLDERRLTVDEIERIRRWVTEGAPEGAPADLPPPPAWTEGWQLGAPDLIVSMPEPYVVPAEGQDVYRNFVIPVPTTGSRYVEAVEFRADSKTIHHAFIRIDGTGQCRRLDAAEAGPGFGGMDMPPSAETPAGHFLSWQPGRRPSRAPRGLAWELPTGADVVLLMHMQPRGKQEAVRASIGFHFTDVAPTNTPIKIGLRSYAIDIPPGATNYIIEESVTLPVDAELLAVLPHAHYLARRIEGFAVRPDGSRRSLVAIPEWNFDWQSDFRYAKPVFLSRGTTLAMRYTYDNSSDNTRNPHHPPVRVKFGLQTTDEMGELWFQMLGRTSADRERLEAVAATRSLKAHGELNEFRLRENPADAEATTELAKVRLTEGKTAAAESLLRRAIQLRPGLDDAHYHLGLVLLDRASLAAAEKEFLETLRLNPSHHPARNNAGLCALRQGRLDEAAMHFREVLRLRPQDTVARNNLDLVARTQRIQGGGR